MNSSTLICFCNRVTVDSVKAAITGGASTLDSVYEKCGAGVGPCGGTCRALIAKELQAAQSNGNSVQSYSCPPEVIEAISLFNRHYYWETHELLEDLWLVERGDTKLFYQGVIQAAAAFYHVLGNNPKGVIRLAEEALKKLQNFGPLYQGTIDIQSLLGGLKLFAQEAKDILGSTSQGFDFDKLPKIQVLVRE